MFVKENPTADYSHNSPRSHSHSSEIVAPAVAPHPTAAPTIAVAGTDAHRGRCRTSPSFSRMFYGPGGPYALFAGRDASRALALMSFDPKDLTGDIGGLTESELEVLQDWEYKFMEKYVKVGQLGSRNIAESKEMENDDSEASKRGDDQSLEKKRTEGNES